MAQACVIASLVFALALLNVTIPVASAEQTAQVAGCTALSVDGARFVFYKSGLTCKKAKGLARHTYRTNKPPRGWKCPDGSPGNNRRDGGQCYRPGTDKSFGYHVAD
jgi:hypothetical protein